MWSKNLERSFTLRTSFPRCSLDHLRIFNPGLMSKDGGRLASCWRLCCCCCCRGPDCHSDELIYSWANCTSLAAGCRAAWPRARRCLDYSTLSHILGRAKVNSPPPEMDLDPFSVQPGISYALANAVSQLYLGRVRTKRSNSEPSADRGAGHWRVTGGPSGPGRAIYLLFCAPDWRKG